MQTIREWRNEEWESDPKKARTQAELQFMARKIMKTAEMVTNDPTPGKSRPELSRYLTCRSTLIPNLEYIIHIEGFTVEDIIETITTEGPAYIKV